MPAKTKRTQKADKNNTHKRDQCQTPYYALDPLLPYLNNDWIIWESAVGQGKVFDKLHTAGFTVTASDLAYNQNFFEYQPEKWDCQVTNPPYSVKYQWLDRSCQLNKPFALLMPVDVLGAAAGQRCIEAYEMEIILLDKRINFHMPNAGYNGGGADFSSAWFTRGLNIGQQLTFGKITYYDDNQIHMFSYPPVAQAQQTLF